VSFQPSAVSFQKRNDRQILNAKDHTMRDFRKLSVWQKSHALTLAVYRETATFPQREMYGLTSQLRRSAASVPANISEGCGRAGGKDFSRFLTFALGSASESEYHVLLAFDLGYLKQNAYDDLSQRTQEVKRMLSAFIRRLGDDE
jgi:four helix bundle protein